MIFKLIDFLFSKKVYQLAFFSIIGLIIFSISYTNGMFWDNVLFVSKMGNHLYNTHIFNWSFPDSFDPGHPPFLAFLNAIGWKIFGYKLWVSHLVILPFIIGFFYQLFNFTKYFIKKNTYTFLGVLLVLSDPSLTTQFVIVNPEILILFAFLLTLNGVFYKKNWQKLTGLLLLSIISYRSMMVFAGVFIFETLNKLYINKEKIKSLLNLNFLKIYFIGSIPAFLFISWRLLTKGWLQTHPNSPWSSLWKIVDFNHFLKNCFFIIQKYADFGRIFVFLFLLISILILRKQILNHKKVKQLILLSFTSVLLIIIVSIISTNTFGHRYFIPSFICLNLLSFYILIFFLNRKKVLFSILFIGLISGNLWIYPREISQGWDATLAHLPYHNLRLKAIKYLDKENIPIEETTSFFPNYTSINNINLNNDYRSFLKFNKKHTYVFYSNVYNLLDEEYEDLDKNYTLIKEFNNYNITIQILKKNDTIRR